MPNESDAPTRPSYLGLLNAISVAEAHAECYLDAWAGATERGDVRRVISTVALREGEHAKAFAKRICELGFDVKQRVDPDLERKMEIASSRHLSDREKFEKLGLAGPVDTSEPDIFAGMMADPNIDITTGGLLGRYIAEERDSGRLFRACYEQLCGEEMATATTDAEKAAAKKRSKSERLTDVEARLARLEGKIDQLLAH